MQNMQILQMLFAPATKRHPASNPVCKQCTKILWNTIYVTYWCVRKL